jgi:hypothetical protein
MDYDVGLAGQILGTSAEAETGGPKSLSQQKFRSRVTRADSPHDRGDFRLPARHAYNATQTDFTLVYCSRAWAPRSRPKPLCL